MNSLELFPSEKKALVANNSDRIVRAICDNKKMIIESVSDNINSENTKLTYLKRVDKFCEFIQDNGIHSFTFDDYINFLAKEYKNPSTFNGYFDAAKKLLTQAYSRFGILPADITLNAKRMSRNLEHKIFGVTENEVKKVKDYISTIKRDSTKLRIDAMFHLMYAQGLRQFEVCKIKLEDINLRDKTLKVQGKGEKDERTVFLFQVTVNALSVYMESLQIRDGYLFANKNGNAISTAYVRKLWTNPQYGIFKKANVENRSVHGFRHYFITAIGKNTNGNFDKMKQFARIKTIETVKKYNDNRLKQEDVAALEAAFMID